MRCRRRQRELRLMLLATAGLLVSAQAQPFISPRGIVSAASYTPPGLPGSAIAQGSIFTIFGTGLGPCAGAQVSAFPFQTTFHFFSAFRRFEPLDLFDPFVQTLINARRKRTLLRTILSQAGSTSDPASPQQAGYPDAVGTLTEQVVSPAAVPPPPSGSGIPANSQQ